MQEHFEYAAITTTSALISVILTIVTLTVLCQGLQNIPYHTSQQFSLKSQAFICLLLPVVTAYYIKMASSG